MNSLNSLRDQIDIIDEKIIELLNKRMETAESIIKVKTNNNFGVCDPSREKQVIDKVKSKSKHIILRENIEFIYQLMIDITRKVQYFEMNLSFPFSKVGIIGFGLMGSSIAKALKEKNESIKISTINHKMNKKAIDGTVIDNEYDSILELMENTEIIILAVPISSIIPIAEEIANLKDSIDHKLLVMDIASVKKDIVDNFEKNTSEKIEFFSTHPMAGSEKTGFENSKVSLFLGCPWLLVDHCKNADKTKGLMKDIIMFFGSKPIFMDAKTHDNKTALISHIPGIISSALWDLVMNIDPQSLEIAGPGFSSVTRLAHDNPNLQYEMSKHNKENINKYLLKFIEKIGEV
jgi:prephenate dehydrogenase/chorismate mutase